MKRLLALLLLAAASATAQVADPVPFVTTFPPSSSNGVAAEDSKHPPVARGKKVEGKKGGNGGPWPDENELHYATVLEMRGGSPDAPAAVQRINNNGEIAGWVYIGADAHAMIYRSGAVVDLGIPAGGWDLSANFAISPSGAVAGYSFASEPGPNNVWASHYAASGATSLTSDGSLTEGVGNIPADSFSYGIRDDLDRVGCLTRYDDIYPDPHHAYYYEHTGAVLTDLHNSILDPWPGSPGVYDFTCARDMNASGNSVGEAEPSGYSRRGWFRTNAGTITILGDFSSFPALHNAKALNDSDMVVGEGRLNNGWSGDYGVRWSAGTFTSDGVHEYSDPSGGPYNSRPNDVDSHGCTTGMMFLLVGEHAYISIAGDRVYDLNLLSGIGARVIQECTGINDSHVVVCRGYDTATQSTTRYYRITLTK